MSWLNPFDGRAQLPIPPEAQLVLEQIPEGFADDGCSNAPDQFWGFDFTWACRIHDWRYCTRCHDPAIMHNDTRFRADGELAINIRNALPWRWRWLAFFYERAVRAAGGYDAFDSCGPEDGPRCRHGMPSR